MTPEREGPGLRFDKGAEAKPAKPKAKGRPPGRGRRRPAWCRSPLSSRRRLLFGRALSLIRLTCRRLPLWGSPPGLLGLILSRRPRPLMGNPGRPRMALPLMAARQVWDKVSQSTGSGIRRGPLRDKVSTRASSGRAASRPAPLIGSTMTRAAAPGPAGPAAGGPGAGGGDPPEPEKLRKARQRIEHFDGKRGCGQGKAGEAEAPKEARPDKVRGGLCGAERPRLCPRENLSGGAGERGHRGGPSQ